MALDYYRCKFKAVGSEYYSMDRYDLQTDDKKEIIEILKEDGYEVLEVYNIEIDWRDD